MKHLNQLGKMLDSGYPLIIMESYGVDRVCDLLLELSRLSTKPFYLAQPGQAMYRLGAPHISIPRTQSPEHLLEHVTNLPHQSIFILRDYANIFANKQNVEQIIKFARGDVKKIIIMVAEQVTLPHQLKPYSAISKHQMKKTG